MSLTNASSPSSVILPQYPAYNTTEGFSRETVSVLTCDRAAEIMRASVLPTDTTPGTPPAIGRASTDLFK